MYKDVKDNKRYEISESLDIMNLELERDKELLRVISQAYFSKSEKEQIIARDEMRNSKEIRDWLGLYAVGALYRNISDYMVFYFCGCPDNFSEHSANDWTKSESFMIPIEAEGMRNSFYALRKMSNEMSHIYQKEPPKYFFHDASWALVEHVYLNRYFNDTDETNAFKSIIDWMVEIMKLDPRSPMGIGSHSFFILLKNELELLADIVHGRSEMDIITFLLDRPNKPYSVSLLIGLLSRRVLEAKLTNKINELTHDPDLLEIRCDWDIPNKMGFLRQSNYKQLADSYTIVNNESKKMMHPLVDIGHKNMDPESYFNSCHPQLKKSAEILRETASQKGYITLLLCIFGSKYGLHKFYLGQWIWGVAYLLTGGLWGLGEIVDHFMLATGKTRNAYDQPLRDNTIGKSEKLFKIINYVIMVIAAIYWIISFIKGEVF